MLTLSLEHLFSISNLELALRGLNSKAKGLDKQTLKDFEKDITQLETLQKELMQGLYIPEPIKKIEITKDDKQKRPIALSSSRDKIVQKTLANALNEYFDPLFSDKSYGYRVGRGTLRAINRCKDYIKRGNNEVYKSDIDNFFETIDHERILSLLQQHIHDNRITRIISLFLQNGGFKDYAYEEHQTGIHQGDALSPLLSNVFLNQMDQFLDRHKINFVRYADDFILFDKQASSLESNAKSLAKFVKTIGLQLEKDKSYFAQVNQAGFEFLGCRFHYDMVSIDNTRLQKKISKLFKLSKAEFPIDEYVSKLNLFIEGLKRYYLKIMPPESAQFKQLETALLESTSQRVFKALQQKELKNKKTIKEAFSSLQLLHNASVGERKDFLKRISNRATEKFLAQKEYKKSVKPIESKKRSYAKKFAHSSVIHVSEYGMYLGVAKNKITIKHKGKLLHTIAKRQCERIIINAKGVGLSSNFIQLCVKESIAIDFIDGLYRPYASLYTHNQAYAKTALKQLEVIKTAKRLELAKAFIKGKAKNQINYLKYLDKYHHDVEASIVKMEHALKLSALKAESVEQLMGYEGEISALYWQGLAKIIEDKINYPGRITYKADDLVNSSLNYAYAILYGRIQYNLIKAGLAINISFLHAIQERKPTLVYDMIEEFRTFVVDRTIVSLINQKEPLKLNSDLQLTKESRQLISKNITERLGSYTKHKKASKKIETIMLEQSYLLARCINDDMKYKPFIGKY